MKRVSFRTKKKRPTYVVAVLRGSLAIYKSNHENEVIEGNDFACPAVIARCRTQSEAMHFFLEHESQYHAYDLEDDDPWYEEDF